MVNKDDIILLAKELMSVASVSGNVEKLVEVLEVAKKHLVGFSFTPFVSNHTPSLLFSNQGPQVKNFRIIFNAHLDVVPASAEQFNPIEKDGKLYGRGAFDTKAAAASMMLVFKEMANKVSFPFALQLTCDEEISGLNGTGYQIKQGIRGEFVIVSECYSNLRVGNQAKGILILKLNTQGKNSHGAYPWLGKNALLRMYDILGPILKAYPVAKEETFETTVNLTKIETHNAAANKTPDNCTAFLDIRFPPKENDTIVDRIKSFLPDDVEISFEDFRTAHYANPKNWHIKTLRELTQKIHGKELPLRFAHGTSDAPFYTQVNCDAVEFGPVGDGAHHDNEWVDIKSLEHHSDILREFLLTVEKEYTKNEK